MKSLPKAIPASRRLELLGLPTPVPEFQFASSIKRRWKFDFCWPYWKVALEVEGGIYGRGKACPACNRKSAGAHTSIQRLLSDMEKYNCAAAMGWSVIRTTPDGLESASTIAFVKQALAARGWTGP